jgi:DUF4097 and DUF4098 domain-containing protein YvlB
MSVFETPNPITAAIDVSVGYINVVATDRPDTHVEVTPTDPGKPNDVKFAETTQVKYAHGKLQVKGPKVRSFLTRGGSVDITVELPTGSALAVDAGLAHVHTEGRLGDCTVNSAAGELQVDHVRQLTVKNANGTVRAETADGDVEVGTAASVVHIGQVGGTVHIKNSTGTTSLGNVAGDITIKGASGEVTIDRAERDVTVKTATGGIRLREVIRGSVSVEAASGEVEIGIRRGSVAWLDLKSIAGRVRNSMEQNAAAPEAGEEKVEIRARLVAGDILIHHA